MSTDHQETMRHSLFETDEGLPPIDDQAVLEYFVIKQEVELDINFREQRIDGSTDIRILTYGDKIETILLDAAQSIVDTENVTISEVRSVNNEPVDGQKRPAAAEYDDPYEKLSHPKGWNWKAEHHDLRRIRARSVFHSRRSDVPAENREFEGCTPVYGSLKVHLRAKGEQDRPRLIIRKSTSNLDGADKTPKQFKIHVPFTTRPPRDGLHFVGVDPLDTRFTHMYTRHSIQPGTASCIFPCIDDHGSRTTWRISIKFPRTLGDALHQALATQQSGAFNDGVNGTQASGQDRRLVLGEEDKMREMSAVCSGFLMEDKPDPQDDRKRIMIFEPEKKISVQKLGFAVGPFEHIDISSEFRTEEDEVKLGISALKVHAYCMPHRAEWVRNTVAALTMAADYFTYTFAKYPFGNFKLCFLDDMVEDTVPLHSMAFVSNRLLFPEDIIDTEIDITRKIIYLLAYQWTGINMIPNTRNDLWLVVGIAFYMTDLFMKKLCGNNEYRFRMKTLSDKLVEADVDRPSLFDLGPLLHLGDFEMDFMILKAPVILFILDKRLIKASGGHGLTRILQKLLTKVQIESSDRSSMLDTEKFRVTCEKGSRYRLETFWSQWVYGSGCPRFDVKARFNKKRLCVELTLNQIQAQTAKKTELDKDNFLRLIKERRAHVEHGKMQPLYTGPMTVRIHEADGTPYEHILEIREDATRATKFEIPYNTKYKRLKRTRRMKEKHNVGTSIDASENADDSLLYCLGDVLQNPEEMKEWELLDWDPETERKMDQESYEWIRVDADFEWAADMKRNLEPYMYVSQLQQDRDVVAQQDAMLYLSGGPLHPIASGFLVRTLLDRRYFHGIRTMAAQALPRQANIKDIPLLGLRQLIKAFSEMFCYEGTHQPKPNDFSNKKQYQVRVAIIKAIAQVRDGTHRCPLEARRFILDQIMYNNNEDNPFSDHYWIAILVEALGTSMIPSEQDDWYARQSKNPNEDERTFLNEALEQIERVLRRDEWTNSYQNIWTLAGLDAKQRLMKAEVIPTRLADFGQYLLDGTRDLIRIKCFEALIDLGAMMDPTVFTFLLFVLSTDRSPYVRHKLIQAVSRGLAAVAFGEHTKDVKDEPVADDEDADPLLLVQDSAQEIEARKEKFARRENLDAALNALRKEMREAYKANDRHYSTAVRKALDQPGLGRAELESMLEVAAMMFEEASEWHLALSLPKAWKVERLDQPLSKRLMVKFRSSFRTQPRIPLSLPSDGEPLAPAAPAALAPAPLPRTSSIKINTKATHRASLPATMEESTIVASTPTPSHRKLSISSAKPGRSSQTPPLPSVKRPRTDKDDSASPAPKRPKMAPQTPAPETNGKLRKLVTLRCGPKRLALVLGGSDATPPPNAHRKSLPGGASARASSPSMGDSITAKSATRRPLPSMGGEASATPVRKPLPTGGSSASPPPRAPSATPAAVSSTSAAPKMTVDTNISPPPPATAAAPPRPSSGSPGVGTPVSARPKIKIVRKPQPPAPE